MTIARISGNAVAEERNLSLDDVPPHKRQHWRPIEGTQPPHDPAIETITGPTYVIEADRVLRVWTVTPRARSESIAAIKAEARNRILTRFPDWKQANMTARGVELQDIWRRNGAWTEAEQAEAGALAAAWTWIKAVRAASDVIEALPDIPADYKSSERWPA